MRDKKLQEGVEKSEISSSSVSPLEMIKIRGGNAHKVRGTPGRNIDSMIAVYKDRFTYTFATKNEVASIHFDGRSKKIFLSGHNIENMKLSEEIKTVLMNVINVLEQDSEGKELKKAYEATLRGQLTDNK